MDDTPITWEEVRNWLEFFGWTTLAIAPFLYWVNGAAVSEDQFFGRWLFVALATLCAVGIRGWRLLNSRKIDRFQGFAHSPSDIQGATLRDITS